MCFEELLKLPTAVARSSELKEIMLMFVLTYAFDKEDLD